MNTDVVCYWWMRGEFAEQRGDWQTGASLDVPGADLLQDDSSVAQMQVTPLGEPPSDFDVRCVYDSRPVNGYDFNFSAFQASSNISNVPWNFTFTVPNGYRAVPRKWDVFYDTPPSGIPSYQSTVTLIQNQAAVPYNGPIIVGMGTGDAPIDSFFVCEENTTFGISGSVTDVPNSTHATAISVNVYGNLIPVTEVAPPFAVTNQIKNLNAELLAD